MSALTPPIMQAVKLDGPCRLWFPRKRAATGHEEGGPRHPRMDRRRKERRGTAIKIHRFTNDRRTGSDRRAESGRRHERSLLPVDGELRHQGISYRITTADISTKGARLLDAPPLEIGALVRLELEPRDDLSEYPLITWAQVRSFCGERAMLGVRFVSLRACDARRLSRLIERAER